MADTTPDDEVPAEPALADVLRDYLVGAFDSSAQAERDAEYFGIQLLTCDVSAPDLGDRVVYVEQAVLTTADAPYRQRLYVITADDDANTAATEVYTLVDEVGAVGLCDETDRPTYTADDVALREGCGVQLQWDGESFSGGTVGDACSSSLSGATYATSEVDITADRIDSWDRGYDGNDEQVWGAVSGPYEFLRR